MTDLWSARPHAADCTQQSMTLVRRGPDASHGQEHSWRRCCGGPVTVQTIGLREIRKMFSHLADSPQDTREGQRGR